ncbi:hypothetical protein SAY86_019427 [Trapa natans]|uniref:Pentatricopeptide repeat-containing protein n=1 Tax=Trapa natans TaxID=22666 RepID=A0AAN7LXE1_TRANT|nr:hypothetical protein SAY86_019427 [Trapa natans]
MWRALSRFSLCRSYIHLRFSSLSAGSSRRKIFRHDSPPSIWSLLRLNGRYARLFSDHSTVPVGDFDLADKDDPSKIVEIASGEFYDDRTGGLAGEDGVFGDSFDFQTDSFSAGEGDIVSAEAREISPEELGSVLSLLQSTADGSLESTLDSLHLSLCEEFVMKVLETPLISGENLIRFFRWALSKPSEFEVSFTTVGALVRSVCRGDPPKKDVYLVWDLVREIGMKQKGEALLDVGILNELLAAFSRLGKGRAALEVLDKFDELECVPDSMSYYFTIYALCKRKSYELALPVCEKMLTAGILPEAEQISNIISWLCQGRLAKNAHSLYSTAKEKGKLPSQSAMNILISLLCRDDETVKFARDMLGDISKEARRYAIKPFSAVISGLCRSKDLDGAKSLLHEMVEAGPPPGNAVFNSVIHGFSKAREMNTALEVKTTMELRGLKPDLFTYTVIISGFVSGGDMEEACKLLKEAKQKHKKLSPVMYHTLIRGYCKLEEFDKALGLLREMKSFGVEPNADEYNKLIQSLCLKALDTETAEKLLEEMKESGLFLNGITRGLIRAVKELQVEELAIEELPQIEA